MAGRENLIERASEAARASGLSLTRDEAGLALSDGIMTVRGDFSTMAARIREPNLQRELIVRASKIKHAAGNGYAVDATAGLGEDSFLLAAAGFKVTLFEKDPVIAALLLDSIDRAAADPALRQPASRMTLVFGDSIEALPALHSRPDVILLDPMFPERRKSAAVKKKLQLIQRLEGPCGDETPLLDAAFDAHPRKVVVKRPVKGPFLAGRKPDYSLIGKAVRFDCHVLPM